MPHVATGPETYPSFAPMFDSYDYGDNTSSPYLVSLNSPGKALSEGIATHVIPNIVGTSPDANAEILALFTDGNWRPHLVGAMTMIVVPKVVTDEIIDLLWTAIRFGSWVSPQLAVAAFLCDPDFAEKASNRIIQGCPIFDPNHPSKSWRRDKKGLAAFVKMYEQLPNASDQFQELVSTPLVAELLANDDEDGDGIAAGWLEQTRPYHNAAISLFAPA